MKMKRYPNVGLSLAFLASVSPSSFGDCTCTRLPKEEATHWGGNMRVEIEQKNHVKILRGVVTNNGTPLQGVLVEAFTNAEHARQPSNRTQGKPNEHRVAACKTGPDGKFCFRSLPSGVYELRSSVDSGWDVTFLNVVVDTKAGKDEQIDVVMQVGT